MTVMLHDCRVRVAKAVFTMRCNNACSAHDANVWLAEMLGLKCSKDIVAGLTWHQCRKALQLLHGHVRTKKIELN